MKKNPFQNEGNALKVQKHQLDQSEKKIAEIDNILASIQSKQKDESLILDNILLDMETLLNTTANDSIDISLEDTILDIEGQLSVKTNYEDVLVVEELDKINISKDMSWEEYISSINEYGFKHNLHLEKDPFDSLMTKSQQIEIYKRVKEDFTFKNANCDKYDYMIAGTCGVIGGLIDILFVGAPGESKLGDITDKQANKITEQFAEFLGWDKNKAVSKGKNTTASAIGFLEKKFKINYDQATTHATGGAVNNLSMSNHHLKSLGHSPDLIGLFFSILNQFTSTSSFISNGKLITINTETFELQGGNFIAKIFCGFANWFGHIMSDWSGSSGTVGQGRRGTGVPIPFYNLLQTMNFGEFGEYKQSFATITTKVFENGYDTRHAMAMAIPVLITELLIRLMYTMKAHFYHQKSWKDSIPNDKIPELRRMLLVGHGTLCFIDGTDAYFRSGGEIVTFLSRTNLIAWVQFGQLSLKELNAWYNSGQIDTNGIDEYLEQEYKRMLRKA